MRRRSLARHLESYLEGLRARHASRSAQELAAQVLPLFFRHLEGRGLRDVRAVSEADVVSFLNRRAARVTRYGGPPSPWTLAADLNTLRSFFSFLERRRAVLSDPTRGVRLPGAPRLPRPVLSEAQARRLVRAPSPWTPFGMRDRAILETLYGTGIRLAECSRTDLPDLDLREGRLLVRNGKGRKDRYVPVAGRAAAALERYLREGRPQLARRARDAALFLSQLGGRLSAVSIQARLRAAARRAGVRASPHSLRHACATHLLRRGADVRHVQELLGHARLETTALYTRVAIGDLRRALARAHPQGGTAARRKPPRR